METYHLVKRRFANAAFYIYSYIVKHFIQWSADPRPTSVPYVSGDGFRFLADHRVDEISPSLVPEKVKKYDRIFVSGAYMKTFFTTYHPRIHVPYILISHNGDECIDASYKKYLSGHLVRWYGQNVAIKDRRIVPIPIGLENLHYYNHGIPWMYRKTSKAKKMKILYGFTASTNPKERKRAKQSLTQCNVAVPLSGYHNPLHYSRILSSYAYVASPSGNGLDCHRTWEALYLGVIPIVKRSVAMEYFISLGLPIYCVDDWKEIKSITEEELRRFYVSKKHGFQSQALWLTYWEQRIRKHI